MAVGVAVARRARRVTEPSNNLQPSLRDRRLGSRHGGRAGGRAARRSHGPRARGGDVRVVRLLLALRPAAQGAAGAAGVPALARGPLHGSELPRPLLEGAALADAVPPGARPYGRA